MHGHPAAMDIHATATCHHTHVRVLNANAAHLPRGQMVDVLEQVPAVVPQDRLEHPSPVDTGAKCMS